MTSCFLSTLSLRRATLFTIGLNRAHGISIHALLAESDAAIFFLYCAFPYFYPRSPCGERRFHFNAGQHICVISIHALLAESDLLPFAMTITALDFYPRSPCGERPKRYLPCCTSRIFLSTLSLRRATSDCRTWTYERLISIHALLAESDWLKSGI